jgi:hypothetical protein
MSTSPLSIQSFDNEPALDVELISAWFIQAAVFALTPAIDFDLLIAVWSAIVASNSYHIVSLASTNHRVIKNGPGTFYGCNAFCDGAYPVYIKLYDQTSTPNPAGGDVPTIVIGVQAGAPRDVEPAGGVAFVAGIQMLIVKGIQDNDNTQVANGDVTCDIFWI